MSDQLIET